MKQKHFFLIIISITIFVGIVSCGESKLSDIDSEQSFQPVIEVINPDIAAQQFCDCSILEFNEKVSCYNSWITTYRNNNTAISQAKKMSLKMAKCSPKDAIEVLEKLMSGGKYVQDSIEVSPDNDIVTLKYASNDFCTCIALSIEEKEACLNSWVLKYRNASGSQSEGMILQKKMQECSADDAKATWKKLLEK